MPADFDFSEFFRNLEGPARERVVAAGIQATWEFGNHVLGEAQALAPIDTGFLRASGYADFPVVVGGEIQMQIGFNADYAAAVHEILDANHPQGQAKFLETALRANASRFLPYVQEKMRAAL